MAFNMFFKDIFIPSKVFSETLDTWRNKWKNNIFFLLTGTVASPITRGLALRLVRSDSIWKYWPETR